MSVLPVPAKQYFQDFAFSLIDVTVKRHGERISIYQGLENREHGKRYIHFFVDADIQVGDVIEMDSVSFEVLSISYDTYEGEKQLIKVFY